MTGDDTMSGSDNAQSGGAEEDTLRDAGKGIDAPRLTPQGRSSEDPDGEDATSPEGGVKTGQPSKAEG